MMRSFAAYVVTFSSIIMFLTTGLVALARQDDPQAWVYFSGSPGLFRMHPDGSNIEILLNDLTISSSRGVTWSSDGQWLFFTGYDENAGVSALYRMNVFDQRLEELATSGGSLYFWSRSPDGKWLHFNDSYGDGLNYLVLMRPDGSDYHSPIPDISYSIFEAWSPDSQWILFEASYESSADIYVVRPDGTDLQNLTQRSEADYGGLISSDGEWIIYNSAQNQDVEIMRMRWDGSDKQNLTNTPDRAEQLVSLSPDGEWVVFAAFDNSASEYFRMHIDGSDAMKLTDSNGTSRFRRWSPDREWIYVEYGYDVESEILRIRVETGEVEQLTDNDLPDLFGRLSPDGAMMVYTSERADGMGELRILDTESGQSTLLTEYPHWVEIADFSPDGEWLYFMLPDDENTLQIHRARLDGSALEQLTDTAGDKRFLTWSQPFEAP